MTEKRQENSVLEDIEKKAHKATHVADQALRLSPATLLPSVFKQRDLLRNKSLDNGLPICGQTFAAVSRENNPLQEKKPKELSQR